MAKEPKKPLFLVLVAIAAVAVVVPMTVFGLPYGRSNPEAFAHLYTATTATRPICTSTRISPTARGE